MVAFAVVGLLGLRFMAGETRRFREEHGELERENRAARGRRNLAPQVPGNLRAAGPGSLDPATSYNN